MNNTYESAGCCYYSSAGHCSWIDCVGERHVGLYVLTICDLYAVEIQLLTHRRSSSSTSSSIASDSATGNRRHPERLPRYSWYTFAGRLGLSSRCSYICLSPGRVVASSQQLWWQRQQKHAQDATDSVRSDACSAAFNDVLYAVAVASLLLLRHIQRRLPTVEGYTRMSSFSAWSLLRT